MKDEVYSKVERIGSGTYGTVYKCKGKDGKVVAVKEIKLENPEEGVPATALREISLLKKLEHPNIVDLLDIEFTEKKIVLIFEFLDADLKKYLDAHKGRLDAETIRSFLYQLLAGIAYCHHHRILHRDLKPQNLLINLKTKRLKLADFGLARAFGNTMRRYSHEVVTLWYRSPDVLLGSTTYPATIDIWSAGCIFAEMVTGKALFPGRSAANQLDTIFRKMGTPNPAEWPGVTGLPEWRESLPQYKPHDLKLLVPGISDEGLDLMAKMLIYDPEKRISAAKALEHPYFEGFAPATYGLDYSGVKRGSFTTPKPKFGK